MTQSRVERNGPKAQPSPCLSGTAYERASAIVVRCGSDPNMERNGTFTVHCPAHNDTNPSFRISYSGEKVLLHCWAGCTAEAICAAIGITLSDLFADDRPRPYPTPSRKRRRATPPDNVPLQFAVSFLIDDPSLLDAEGVRDVFRASYQSPVERLWVEKELARHGMDARIVWQVVQPGQGQAAPRIVTRKEVQP
jgi:hypothetical protein